MIEHIIKKLCREIAGHADDHGRRAADSHDHAETQAYFISAQAMREIADAIAYTLLGTEDYKRGALEQHVEDEGAKCPNCKGGQLEGGSVDTGLPGAYQEMRCLECGAGWNDLYTLAGFADLVTEE